MAPSQHAPCETGDRTGTGSRARTYDLRFWRPPLYQLSYARMRQRTDAVALVRLPDGIKPKSALAAGENEVPPEIPAEPEVQLLGNAGDDAGARRKTRGARFANIRFGWVRRHCSLDHSVIEATIPAPTVRPPSRMAKRSFSSMAIGTISSTSTVMLSPGITISVPSGSDTMPVTSVVRK
jgi:hypothetical protein